MIERILYSTPSTTYYASSNGKTEAANEELIKKTELMDIYKSQSFIKEMFNQMFPYEEWTKYENIVSYEVKWWNQEKKTLLIL